MSVEQTIKKLNDANFLITNIYQSHFGKWEVVIRSPYSWHLQYGSGDNIAEAVDRAAEAAFKAGLRPKAPRKRKTRVRLRQTGKKQRVRL